MADALVSLMLEKLATVIQDQIQQEVNLVVGAEKEVKKLTTTFKVIQAVLNDAEQRQIKDEAVKLWLEEFKDIAYDMDDVLDEWSSEMHNYSLTDTKAENKKKVIISSYLHSLCSCFSKVALRHNIGSKIKDIKERLDLAESEKQKYRLIEMKSDDKPIERLKTSSLVDVTDILGRVTDKETIMNKLMFLGESSSTPQALHAPNIIAIVGMGGLGKTSLAQLVFNDDQVKTHFEKTMWVCVSDPFDLVIVTKSIIKEAKCEVPNSSEWDDTLHRSLSESIKGKRFLLVLDDVWTYDRKKWELLKISFKLGAKGSRILVTTRKENVAVLMNATYTHSLGVLSDNDCSLLLSRIALAGRNEENYEELKKIGEEISKKCKGLPLAAKTLGGLLLFKKSKTEWLRVLESEIWELEEVEDDNHLMPSLLLSYYDLPLRLKGCFVYCSIFPKDHIIQKDVLVKLWMAQGFLNKSGNGNEDLEANGEDYFNNLAMRSFFQDFTEDDESDDNGNRIECKMHDLVHDLAQYLTKNECSVKHNNDTVQLLNSSSRVRHLTLVCDNEVVGHSTTDSYDHIASAVCNAKKLRTLHILNYYIISIKEAPADLFHRFRCLKVLRLSNMGLENLSGEIENLIHLRYLDLSRNYKLKILPETISNLYNLQTLKLESCHSLCELPRKMSRMINLRHLHISGSNELSHIPQGIGGLTCLRTLNKFIVGGANEEGCKISELKYLNLLQGGLSIRGLGRVETVNEAWEIQLKQKHFHTLMLGFGDADEDEDEDEENELEQNLENLQRREGVLQVLEPHPDVVKLVVQHYLGFKLSRWMESTSILSHVKTLKLVGCINLTKFPAFGQLPSLEVLYIRKANKVKHIGLEFYSNNSTTTSLEHVMNRVVPPFPKLKELHMYSMDNLEVWELPHGVVMPCLRVIVVSGCTEMKALPALGKLPSLEALVIEGADELTHIGCEFLYEVDEDEEATGGGEVLGFNNTAAAAAAAAAAFPKLEFLRIIKLWSKEEELEWEFGGVKEIMPCLRQLSIPGFKNLKFLEMLSSLEFLSIEGEATEFIKYIRHDDDDDDDLHTARELLILFPNLKRLKLCNMEDMEELKIGFQVMPLLNRLTISNCNKLKAIIIHHGGSFSKLESLELGGCASLSELPPIPNLKSLELIKGLHPSLLPEAFASTKLQALEFLRIPCGGDNNNTLTCIPEQVQQLTSLKSLDLWDCGDELKQRCRKDQGEDWRIISHIPNIRINHKLVN